MRKPLYASDLPDHYDEEAEVQARRSGWNPQTWLMVIGGVVAAVIVITLAVALLRMITRSKRSWLLG